MNAVSIITKKRDGEKLRDEEICWFVSNFVANKVTDYQMAAFLMACFIRGLDKQETAVLTKHMLHSGDTLKLHHIPKKKADKHSTGGVGDKTSLILAPIVAACGVAVPMISGRGLGHTGGTLDKLESIPGFDVRISLEHATKILERTGCTLIGQTKDIAPADRRMYALRDVTGTVECIPLIASSIMSKKLAEDLDALVLDVKFGSGAFMKSLENAKELAQTLIAIGRECETNTVAFITNMNQPLGHAVGNWLEVKECIDVLRGGGPKDVRDLSVFLAAAMIRQTETASSMKQAVALCEQVLQSGKAFEVFKAITAEHHGDTEMLDHPEKYPLAKTSFDVVSAGDGFITGMNTHALGMLSVNLGAGRHKAEDQVDAQAGFVLHKKLYDKVRKGDVLATVYTNKSLERPPVIDKFLHCLEISDKPASQEPLVKATFGFSDQDSKFIETFFAARTNSW